MATAHRIRLILIGDDHVAAVPNPQPGVAPGDTVTWVIETNEERDPATLEPRIVFKERQELPANRSDPGPSDPNGPFLEIARTAGEICGTVAQESQGRFIYDVFIGDTRLNWVNRLEGQNFGGIDLPKPPPD